jgi:release factor glutamine methyltransferase
MKKEIQWILKEKYNGKPSKEFKKDVKRFEKGEPLDYIIGFKEFLGCKIDLSKKPLIPRPETEYWTAKAVEEIKIALAMKKSAEDVKSTVNRSWGRENYELKALDIFAGSGCVGIAILANVENLLCDFSDIDKNNLKQIKINLDKNFVDQKKYKVIQSDIFSKIKNKYDFIFANPPYIPTKNKSKIQKSVLKYEPKKALFGGADGMKFINKFLKDAKKHLNEGGKIFMEFDPPQKNKIEKLLKKYKYASWQFNKDQYGKLRWVVIK